MKLLLDTHAFLWYITNDPRLPRQAFDAIRDKSNEVHLSVVSVWETLVKHQIGKLTLPAPADRYIADRQSAHRITTLNLDAAAVSHLLTLPLHHRDPFDRMLICQAMQNELTIVTVDEQFQRYPIPLLPLV
ncbi:MAG TPA: type II toxin-antitoxin system VapC family toxin [Thermoanaerobaculia bacterium]